MQMASTTEIKATAPCTPMPQPLDDAVQASAEQTTTLNHTLVTPLDKLKAKQVEWLFSAESKTRLAQVVDWLSQNMEYHKREDIFSVIANCQTIYGLLRFVGLDKGCYNKFKDQLVGVPYKETRGWGKLNHKQYNVLMDCLLESKGFDASGGGGRLTSTNTMTCLRAYATTFVNDLYIDKLPLLADIEMLYYDACPG